MGDTFLRTLQSVVAGARAVEELAGVLVSAAVEDSLLCVARDFGHDYSALLRRYKAEVVGRHVTGTLGERGVKCRGSTRTGKPCSKAAQLQGFCHAHAQQMAQEAAKRRKVEAYKASVPRRDEEGALVELWLGGRPVPADAYAVAVITASGATALL